MKSAEPSTPKRQLPIVFTESLPEIGGIALESGGTPISTLKFIPINCPPPKRISSTSAVACDIADDFLAACSLTVSLFLKVFHSLLKYALLILIWSVAIALPRVSFAAFFTPLKYEVHAELNFCLYSLLPLGIKNPKSSIALKETSFVSSRQSSSTITPSSPKVRSAFTTLARLTKRSKSFAKI